MKHTKLEKNVKTKVSKEREKLNTIDGDKELKLDKKLAFTNDEHEIEGIAWKTKTSIETQRNLDGINRVCQSKMPMEIFVKMTIFLT